MELFGVGPAEALLVVVIALIVVGPQRFPQYAREAAKWYRIGRRYAREITDEIRGAVGELDAEAGASEGLGGILGGLNEVRDLARDFTDSARSDLRAVRDDAARPSATAASVSETSTSTAANDALQAPRELPASDDASPDGADGGTFVTHATVLEIPAFSTFTSAAPEPEPLTTETTPTSTDKASNA